MQRVIAAVSLLRTYRPFTTTTTARTSTTTITPKTATPKAATTGRAPRSVLLDNYVAAINNHAKANDTQQTLRYYDEMVREVGAAEVVARASLSMQSLSLLRASGREVDRKMYSRAVRTPEDVREVRRQLQQHRQLRRQQQPQPQQQQPQQLHPLPHLYHALLNYYAKRGDKEQAVTVIEDAERDGVQLGDYGQNMLLEACGRGLDFESARELFELMCMEGSATEISYNLMIDICAQLNKYVYLFCSLSPLSLSPSPLPCLIFF